MLIFWNNRYKPISLSLKINIQDFIDNAVESALDENRENSTEKEYIEDALSTDSDAKVLCNVCKMVFKDSSSLDNHVFESTYCYNYYMQDYWIKAPIFKLDFSEK